MRENLFNNNTGITPEAGFALRYIQEKEKLGIGLTNYEAEVKEEILLREDYNEIKIYAEATDLSYIINYINSRYEIVIATQDDSLGPADIAFRRIKDSEIEFGVSIKDGNSCQSNISGSNAMRIFGVPVCLTEEDKRTITERYIDEMRHKRGETKNWFRRRMRSDVVNAFFKDTYIIPFCEAFNNVSDENIKAAFLNKALQTEVVVPYIICKYTKRKGIYKSTYYEPPVSPKDRINDIVAKLYRGSYVGFYNNDTLLYKMQTKFNNGILERSTPDGNGSIDLGDGIYAKFGDPCNSWNFSIVNNKVK